MQRQASWSQTNTTRINKRIMYINFWYPVCIADELPADNPVQAQILGLRFVAFRDGNGEAHVLADTCIHRGGSLSKGKLVDGNVACPYHGWQFGGSGRCVHIPSLPEGSKVPGRAKVDSYPVIERYGIVFAFLGDLPEEERPPLFDIPQWDQEGWRASGLVTFELDAYFERSIENGLDPVHNEFVHDLQGNIRFKPDDMTVDTDAWGTKVYVRMDPPKMGTTQLENLRNDDEPEHFGASSYHSGPNTLVTKIDLSKNNSFVQYFFEQPIDASHTRIFFINLRNCMLEKENDQRLQNINLAIAEEDIAIVSELYPKRTPETSTKEILIVGDECIGAYRQHLKTWESRGWRIDLKALRHHDGDVAFAIPSPERRTSKGWVLDTVPLVQAS
jgi:phenylpropionate dioxygenase-like ring-hydroxylating dioxygenase large terminal subunit